MKMAIHYVENADIAPELLTALYRSVGWTVYANDADTMAALLPNSLYSLSVWEGERLLGLLRAVGDGLSIVYIQDILVHPDDQRRGIGRELLMRTFEHFKTIRQIVLLTDDAPETAQFYKACGMQAVSELSCKAFIKLNA